MPPCLMTESKELILAWQKSFVHVVQYSDDDMR